MKINKPLFKYIINHKILNHFFNLLFKSNKLKFEDFKKLTNFFSYNGLNFLYEFSLKKYDSNFVLDKYKLISITCNFTTGVESLNTYRVLDNKEKWVFEKIYKINSEDLNRTLYFYKNYSNKFFPNASLLFTKSGKKLVACYFEYLKHDNSNNDFLDIAINFTVNSLNQKLILSKIKLQENDQYLQALNCSENYFSKSERQVLLKVKKIVFKKIIFCHGDITIESKKNTNVIAGKLIDFDRSGYYPFGFDVGRALSSYIKSNDPFYINQSISLLDRRINRNLSKNEIEISIYYFSLLFILRKFMMFPAENNYNKKFINMLYSTLEQKYLNERSL